MMSSGFSLSGWLAEVRTQVPTIFSSQQYTFQTVDGTLCVRTEGVLAHSRGTSTRARCNESGQEFDLRRLRVSAKAGGLVTLQMLQALERESDLAANAGSHPHIVRCHATLVENVGVEHCRLLLREPCCSDLAAHLRSHGGRLPAGATAELGEQLSLGLRHLHSSNILCGSIAPQGILLGCDGKWKLLGDLGPASVLPVHVQEWRRTLLQLSSEDSEPLPLPPEARIQDDEADVMATLELDVWMLGALLAGILEGVDSRCIASVRTGRAVLMASQAVLLCPFSSRLWLLLHWLLAMEPIQRPSSWRLVEITHSLSEMFPHELLIEMPEYARFHCQGMATATARSLAYSSVASTGANRSCTAGLPLEVLRMSLVDPTAVDQLCGNCGLELDDLPSLDDGPPDVPSLVPVLSVPVLEACSDSDSMLAGKASAKIPCSTERKYSGMDTDASTDTGSTSDDESITSCTRSMPCNSDIDQSFSPLVVPRQRRPVSSMGLHGNA